MARLPLPGSQGGGSLKSRSQETEKNRIQNPGARIQKKRKTGFSLSFWLLDSAFS
jgi:hypothetical protein